MHRARENFALQQFNGIVTISFLAKNVSSSDHLYALGGWSCDEQSCGETNSVEMLVQDKWEQHVISLAAPVADFAAASLEE